MYYTAHLLHPSQTVMSYFKEPQRAVAEIQRILDGDYPACALLADLSKAFERVNPHWIMHLLRLRGAPRWILTYARFVLFHRRVMHKVQGRLLPSRTIRQGVDMGRSFSVYLFCLAMDPLFHYLNRIPGVISVQAYVDDTTIAGIASDPKWVHDVADAYRRVATAGFQVDSRNCFRAVVNDTMRFAPRLVTTEELLDYWPMVVSARQFSTLQEAISGNLQPGRCTRVVRLSTADLTHSSDDVAQRNHHVCVNLSYSQTLDILSGACMHETTALLAGPCACKSKSCVVTNYDLSPIYLKTLDDTKYGAQSVVSQAPALGLVLMARRSIKNTGEWGDVSEQVAYAFFASHNSLSSPEALLSILTFLVLCRTPYPILGSPVMILINYDSRQSNSSFAVTGLMLRQCLMRSNGLVCLQCSILVLPQPLQALGFT